jgi:hypothetical protein
MASWGQPVSCPFDQQRGGTWQRESKLEKAGWVKVEEKEVK